MTNIKPCSVKAHADLVSEWDRLAEERHRQIASGDDLSFHHVVVPTTWQLLEGTDRTLVLEIGSGTGEFTLRLARSSGLVVAVEPSKASMALARRVCQGVANVRYVETPLEEAGGLLGEEGATTAVAVMTLMTAPDLRGLAKALAGALRTHAKFVATLTHPCFWPRYWGYEQEPWFRYDHEMFIEAPFVISKRRTGLRTTHIHRPLERYLTVFAEEGFALEAVAEPMPTLDLQSLYPRRWEFPRFLGLRWTKVV
ncbi:MAG: methyltransferase domain-containing protein [Propionivibrio sp.]|nr:methyltransferase domain-containing protein [Propionivibrio sp.]